MNEKQVEEIKAQIIAQVKKSFPPERQEHAINQIKSMSSDELKEFLKKNNIEGEFQNQECIFCSIANKKIPSYSIAENEWAIAALEINPVSSGHIIVIPKSHEDKLEKEIHEFAKEVAKKLKILSPKKIEILPSAMFGHKVLNILPIYSDETLSSPRKKANEEELTELQKTLSKEKSKEKKTAVKKAKPKVKKIKEKVAFEDKLWLPKRLP